MITATGSGIAILAGGQIIWFTFTISYHGGAAETHDVILTEVAETSTTVTCESSFGEMVSLMAHVTGIGTSLVPSGIAGFQVTKLDFCYVGP